MVYCGEGKCAIKGTPIDFCTDISVLTNRMLEQTPVVLREFMVNALKQSIDVAYELITKRTDEKKAEGNPTVEELLEKILNGGYAEEDKENECE